jgi:transposase
MGRPYSLDLRERAVAAMAGGMSGREAAKHYNMESMTICGVNANPFWVVNYTSNPRANGK